MQHLPPGLTPPPHSLICKGLPQGMDLRAGGHSTPYLASISHPGSQLPCLILAPPATFPLDCPGGHLPCQITPFLLHGSPDTLHSFPDTPSHPAEIRVTGYDTFAPLSSPITAVKHCAFSTQHEPQQGRTGLAPSPLNL